MPAPKGHPPYPGCETGGRPQKYSDEFIDQLADDFFEWYKKEENIWLLKFFGQKKIHPSKIYIFAERNEKFREIYEIVKGLQEARIFEGALKKKYFAPTAHFSLAIHYGWPIFELQKIANEGNNAYKQEVEEACKTQTPLSGREKIE